MSMDVSQTSTTTQMSAMGGHHAPGMNSAAGQQVPQAQTISQDGDAGGDQAGGVAVAVAVALATCSKM